MDCTHEDAVYNLEFNRFSDEKGIPRKFSADLTIFCRHCGAQFAFKDAVVSRNTLTLSTTIEPEIGMPDEVPERISESLDLRDLFLHGQDDERA